MGVAWRGFLASISRPGRAWINWRARKCSIPANAIYDFDRSSEDVAESLRYRNAFALAGYLARREAYQLGE
jgi:hypothetical protein